MYKHILIATDGSEIGQKGVDQGLSLAKALGAGVTIITVTEPFPIATGGDFGFAPSATVIDSFASGQREVANSMLSAAKQAASAARIEAEIKHVADAEPAEAIIEAARSLNCDLIVMGSHGRRGIGRLVLGSKTWEVVARSHAPVLVVR